MSGRLQSEIRQSRPFAHPAEETFLNLLRTAGWLERAVEDALRPSGLTQPQYNVLRILQGAGKDGLPCGEVGARMITRDPDMTRLLDRMEKRGLIQRSRSEKDRRVVRAYLAPEGATALKALEKPVRETIRRALEPLGETKLTALTGLLEEVRIQMEADASIR